MGEFYGVVDKKQSSQDAKVVGLKSCFRILYEEGGTVCPNCGSEDIEERPTAFYPINYKESA